MNHLDVPVEQAFRDNRQLQQFVLSDVTPTGRILGTGSFGSVEEVCNYDDLLYILLSIIIHRWYTDVWSVLAKKYMKYSCMLRMKVFLR